MADGQRAWNYPTAKAAPVTFGQVADRGRPIILQGDWKMQRGRGRLLVLVLLGHLLAFWLVIRTNPSGDGKPLPTLQLINVSAASVPAPAPPVAVEPKASPRPPPPAVPEPAPIAPPLPQLAGGIAPAGGCALGAEIGAAIQTDVKAMNALAALPADLRSTADAVMLWNGQWVSAERPETRANVLLLQQVIARSVMTATPECRLSPNAGPQFIPVSERDHTTMIVVGSGEWRWASLIQPDTLEATSSQFSAPASGPNTATEAGRAAPWWRW